MDIIHGDIDANENHVTTLLDDVEKHGADLVVFRNSRNTRVMIWNGWISSPLPQRTEHEVLRQQAKIAT